MHEDARGDAPAPSFARLALTILAPFAAGYFLSYLFRSVNAVVAPALVADIGLGADELGLLTAAYLLAFALFQVPLGILLDRFGPRRVQAALLSTAALGAVIFALGEHVAVLTFGRALIGLGFAGGLMGGFKAIVLWVSPARRALANGCVMSFGGLGLIVATKPAFDISQAIGWRGLFELLAVVTIIVALLILMVVPEKAGAAARETFREQFAGVIRIYRNRAFWRLAPLLATTGGTHIAIQTLWAGPWFRDVAGLDPDQVAWYLTFTAAAFLAGILLSGVVADLLGRLGFGLLRVMTAGLVAFMVAQAGIAASMTSLNPLLWAVFGMTGQLAILAYPWLSMHFGTALSGRANTAMNLLVFGTAFAIQYAIGEIIELFPSAGPDRYPPLAYHVGFGVFLAAQVLALAWCYRPGYREEMPD